MDRRGPRCRSGFAGQDTGPPAGLLGPAEWDTLEQRGHRSTYERAQVLFVEGDAGGSVIALRVGRAKISVQTLLGRELLLAVKGPGELLGEMSALDGRPRSATAIAMETVQAVVVSAGAFHEFLHAHPTVTLRLLQALSGELRDTDKLLADRDAGDATSRTALRLVYLAGRYGEHNSGNTHVGLALTHEDLASWIGVSREATSRALGQLRGAGYITTERRSITVIDLAGLRRYVADHT